MFRTAVQRVLRTNTSAVLINYGQKRTELTFRRMYPPSLRKKGETKTLKEREYVYIMEENLEQRRCPDIKVILTMDIEELGLEGDVLSVSGVLAREYLLPGGAAVYASPENIKKYEPIVQANAGRPRQSIEGQRTVRFLSAMTLPVPMSPEESWILDKRHLRIAFRRVGIVVPEKNITLPSQSIKEPGEFAFKVLVNNIDSVNVKGVVILYEPESQELQKIQVFQDTTRKIEDIVRETVARHRANRTSQMAGR